MKNVAIVTGASGGIGYEFVKLLAKMSYNILLVSRNEAKLNRVKTEMESTYSIKCLVMPLDLSKEESANLLFSKCIDEKLDVSVIINNAGVGLYTQCINQKLEDTQRLITLNIISLTNLCTLFGKYMSEKGSGYILNVGSLGGKIALPYFATYAASKSYVYHYSIAIRNELRKMGVTVTCLLPGYVKTQFDENAKIDSQEYKKLSNNIGMNPAKVAKIGLKSLFKKRGIVTAGLSNKIIKFFSNLVSKNLIAKIAEKYLSRLMSKKKND